MENKIIRELRSDQLISIELVNHILALEGNVQVENLKGNNITSGGFRAGRFNQNAGKDDLVVIDNNSDVTFKSDTGNDTLIRGLNSDRPIGVDHSSSKPKFGLTRDILTGEVVSSTNDSLLDPVNQNQDELIAMERGVLKASYEPNNVSNLARSTTVDLSISFGEIITTPTFFPEEEGEVEVMITNNGHTRFSGSVELAIFASSNPILDDDLDDGDSEDDYNVNEPGALDVLEGLDEVLSDRNDTENVETLTVDALELASGESETIALDFSSPELRTASVVAPGLYFLLAEVDPNNIIAESNEDNNVAAGEDSAFISTDGTNVVLDWNSAYLNAVQASGVDAYGFSSEGAGTDGTIPPVVPRNGALLHTAIFDAVNAFEGEFQPFAVDLTPPQGASPEAAAVGAAFTVLSSDELYPEMLADFDAQVERSLAEIGAERAGSGFQFGVDVAEELIELRSNDFTTPPGELFEPSDEPGSWRPSYDGVTVEPEGPQFESVPPFFIPSTQQFRTSGPPEFGSPRFAAQTEEVRLNGGLEDTAVTEITRTDEGTEIAQFWSFDRTDSFRPPGHWNQIAQDVILQSQESGNELSLVDTARLFAQLNIALTDAGVVAWDSKFDFAQLRPEQTINANPADGVPPQPGGGDFDGNPVSIEDPDWNPLLASPAFPDYTSAHAAFGGAAAEVLASFLGDDFSFESVTQELPGLTRSFDSFLEAAIENSNSRVFGGVHLISSSLDGLESGVDIGQFVADNALAPAVPA